MITLNKIGGYNNVKEAEFKGLSGDTKPIADDIPNGSVYYEMDTSLEYRFDAENKVWLQQ